VGSRIPRVLGIVPARGGSKGVPRKNIRLLAGKPLLVYTAEAALRSSLLTRTVLSTEDEEIAQCGRSVGLDVPFMRPPELARDTVPTLAVLRHVVERLDAEGEAYDAVCILQPTTPFRQPGEIDECIERWVESGADTVVTVERVPDHYNPEWVWFERAGRLELATGRAVPIPRRQELPPAFHRTGSVYVVRTATLMAGALFGESVAGFEVQPGTVNIDTLEDWEAAERALATRES
tara:strand:- start:1919 stop:2623 length:705 start_codon:yes stop_codon:yes gene_type:complete